MFIVLRKKIIKRYLVLALAMILAGRVLTTTPTAQASTITPQTITADELRYEGFSGNDLKSMGFVNGIGKIIIYNAKQKQIWNQRVEQARERVEVARRTGKKINPRDKYLLERDEQIKNPPKKPLGEKLFGKFGVQVASYFKSDESAKIVGNGLTIGGCALFLIKALAPLAI